MSGAVKKVAAAKKVAEVAPEPEVLLPLLEAGGPDERLFILCGCGHTAALHSDAGCQRIIPAKSKTGGGYGTKDEHTPETACTCPTPREVVYFAGRKPAELTA